VVAARRNPLESPELLRVGSRPSATGRDGPMRLAARVCGVRWGMGAERPHVGP
jgi:hypothetical protein